MKSIAVGIDIGGTNTKYGLVDPEGELLAASSMSTIGYPQVEDYVAAVSHAIKDMIANLASPVEIKGIGIGAPNGNYYTGTIEQAPNLVWKGIVPLVELFNQHFEVPVIVTNDANAAAIGELMYGAAKGFKDFAIITLGTGVGSGFLANGELIYGHDGFAGEFGHVTAVRGGRLCTCGRRGCVETYASARGVVLTVQEELAATQADSELRHLLPEEITPKHIFEAAEKGDPIAQHAFEYTGKILGEALSNLVAYTSPAAIFFFGGVARAGDWILEPTKRHMEENLLNIYKDKVALIPSGLPDSDAAILGASALVWKEIGESMVNF
ncbi:MAG: ROK family protein [Bacteroidota bacterium]